MSASAILQKLISERLPLKAVVTLGDGDAEVFTLTHGLNMQTGPSLQITATEGGALLVEGTDYSVEVTDENSIQVTALIGPPAADAWSARIGCLRVDVPIVKRREKELLNKIQAAAANHGLCIYVMPSLPTRAMQGSPDIFFEAAEVRVRIIEQPAKNKTGADAYDLMDDVFAALHWQLFGTVLSHPLQMAVHPAQEVSDESMRIIDCIFEATYGLRPSAAA